MGQDSSPAAGVHAGPVADKTQATLEAETEDLDLVRRHCELAQVVLLGWSYHGAGASNYASRHPDAVERVIMSGPLAPSYSEQAAAALQSRLDMQAIADLMKSPPTDPAAATKAWHDIVLRGYFADGGAYARSFPKPRQSDNERIGNVNQHLNALILIAHGQSDFVPLEGSREWQRSFPNARLVVVFFRCARSVPRRRPTGRMVVAWPNAYRAANGYRAATEYRAATVRAVDGVSDSA